MRVNTLCKGDKDKDNDDDNNYLQLGRHPVAGVILHIALYMHGL